MREESGDSLACVQSISGLSVAASDQLASRQLVAGSSRSSAPSCNRAGSRSPSIAMRNTEARELVRFHGFIVD